MLELIRIYALSIKRSSLFEAKLIIKILTLIGFGYILVNLIGIGFYLDKILVEIEPESTPIDTFSRYFLFLFLFDVILKFFYKSNEHIDTTLYLTLPVNQRKIFSLLFLKELLSKWNFIWVTMLAIFFFKSFYPDNGLFSTALLILLVYFTSITISFILRFIDIASVQNPFLYRFLPILLVIGLGYLAFHIAVAPNLIINVGLLSTNYKILVFIGIILLFSILFLVFLKCCKYEIYLHQNGRDVPTISLKISWLSDFGVNGEILKLCLKEISRSQLKRSVSVSLMFLISYLFLFKFEDASFFVRLFLAITPVFLFGVTLGELSFNSESTFFDKLMVTPRNTAHLILIYKYIICVCFAASTTLISIIVYNNRVSILFWVSIFFFECGILLFFFFQNAVYNNQRFDIMGSFRKIPNLSIFSLLSMGLTIPSIGIVFLIAWLTSETAANYFMLTVGILFTLTSPFWLKNIYDRFLARKYQNMNGFRNI